ncbi:MAG: TetR/AcrR family transcriptional regulator [Deltaproteobacteria bacterium]|nr:TetR/AcrR family transcriptional regulator [Deltaproteobacteria bacterium]MBW2361289.1 TetR/AcrR family transcriptional regulator [Deltaproteobacteria bacterium]
MTTPSPSSQGFEIVEFSSLEPHGERRKRQLVRAAAHIVEFEGLDALRMPRVAELAGCTRTLIYRYFPGRDDLLIAVAAEYYSALDERLDQEAQKNAAQGIPPPQDALEITLTTLDIVFEVVTELGLAGLMLRSSAHLSEGMREYLARRSEHFSARWVEPMRRSGLSGLRMALFAEASIALLIELVHRWQHEEILREEAMALCRSACIGLLSGLQEPPPQ